MSANSLRAHHIIDALHLEPLAGEGGFFRQTWVLQGDDGPAATAIYYLVTPESFSGLHRLVDAELFHFYLGDACEQVIIDAEGRLERRVLGHGVVNGELVQSLVPGGCWQGTKLRAGGRHGFALLGTTMTPGFCPERFELAGPEDLEELDASVRNEVEQYLAQ